MKQTKPVQTNSFWLGLDFYSYGNKTYYIIFIVTSMNEEEKFKLFRGATIIVLTKLYFRYYLEEGIVHHAHK